MFTQNIKDLQQHYLPIWHCWEYQQAELIILTYSLDKVNINNKKNHETSAVSISSIGAAQCDAIGRALGGTRTSLNEKPDCSSSNNTCPTQNYIFSLLFRNLHLLSPSPQQASLESLKLWSTRLTVSMGPRKKTRILMITMRRRATLAFLPAVQYNSKSAAPQAEEIDGYAVARRQVTRLFSNTAKISGARFEGKCKWWKALYFRERWVWNNTILARICICNDTSPDPLHGQLA